MVRSHGGFCGVASLGPILTRKQERTLNEMVDLIATKKGEIGIPFEYSVNRERVQK